MKKNKQWVWLVLFIASMLTIVQCKKSKTIDDQLPPETQTGANTFGCLINGKVFIPKGTNGTGTPNPKVSFELGLNGLPLFYIVVNRLNVNRVSEGEVLVAFQNISVNSQHIYPNNFSFSVGWPQHIGTCATKAFDTTIKLSGKGKLTRYDTVNKIISGTFDCKFKINAIIYL